MPTRPSSGMLTGTGRSGASSPRSLFLRFFYIVRRQAGLAAARAAVQACLNTLDIAPVDQITLLAAQAMAGPDFEDGLQTACAVQAGVDAIVTRDTQGFAASPVPVLLPADLVAALSGPGTP